ncbi:VanZ family protein [Kineococcus sp. GCM10028916]
MGWLPTFLVEHSALVPLGVLVVVVGSAASGWVGRRSPRVLGWLVGLALLGVLTVTLAPDDRGRVHGVTCEVGIDFPSWGSSELLANVALFVPVTVLAVVRFRRPVFVGLGGIVLSAAIEGTQALAVVLGRSCTTSDWAMNTAGTVLGVGVGAALLVLDRTHAGRAGAAPR